MTKYSVSVFTSKEEIPIALFSDDISINTLEKISQIIVDSNKEFIGYSIYDFETGEVL